MGYSLAAKFASEAIGMCLVIFLGEGIIANELLPNTKGHAMGILGVSVGFGFAFGVNIAWFGHISAHFNPAMFFFLAILGKLEDGWAEFAVGACADFLGAFCGACLVYLYFADHFWTVPLPPDENHVATLLHGYPDALSDNAGRIASAFGPASKKPTDNTIGKEFRAVGTKIRGRGTAERESLLEKMEVRRQNRSLTGDLQQLRRNKSIQVADLLHQKDAHLLQPIQEGTSLPPQNVRRHSAQVAGLLHTHDKQLVVDVEEQPEATDKPSESEQPDEAQELRHETYMAAMEADAHAKLSIFATRPAKYNRFMNFMQEMLATAVLVFGAEMFSLRREYEGYQDGVFTQAMFLSFFIMLLILGLGGTTGLATNPARDFGPRCAHAVLPIPGKGSNEWNYAVVPFFAPFVGAVLGAGLFWCTNELYKTGSDEL